MGMSENKVPFCGLKKWDLLFTVYLVGAISIPICPTRSFARKFGCGIGARTPWSPLTFGATASVCTNWPGANWRRTMFRLFPWNYSQITFLRHGPANSYNHPVGKGLPTKMCTWYVSHLISRGPLKPTKMETAYLHHPLKAPVWTQLIPLPTFGSETAGG